MMKIFMAIVAEYGAMFIAGSLNSLVFTGMGTMAIIIPIELITAVAQLRHALNMELYRIAVSIIFPIFFIRGSINYEHFWE